MNTSSSYLSVLGKATSSLVENHPFPYIVIRDAIPKEACDELIATYPHKLSSEKVLSSNESERAYGNARYDYHYHQVLSDPRISKIWKDFISYHVSSSFWSELVNIFGENILKIMPDRFSSIENLKKQKVGIRGKEDYDQYDVLLDAMISGNTPVLIPSSSRPNHIDLPSKLYAGLFYLRLPEDDSTGGDLEISEPVSDDFLFTKAIHIEKKYAKVTRTIKYDSNVLVLFINSLYSWHGVTVRHPTKYPRLFMNLVGEMQEDLFDCSKNQPPEEAHLLQTRLKDLYAK